MKRSYIGETEKNLLSLLGHSLFSAPLSLSEGISWEAVWRESTVQSVSAIAFEGYRALPLSAALKEEIGFALRARMAKNAFCFSGHAFIHKLLSEKNIPYSIIKGVASARYYPEPLLRNMGDVDFFLPREHVAAAEEALIQAGFARLEEEHDFHTVFYKGNAHLELHFAPISAPEGELKEVFDEYWERLVPESSEVTVDAFTVRLPSPFMHGFILLSHLRGHLLSGGVGLRHLTDFAVFANSLENGEFVSLFEKKLKRAGLWRLAEALALAAVLYMGMPRKDWMGKDEKTAEALLADILSGGNFGRKDSQRGFEDLFVSGGKGDKVEKSRFRQGIRSLNRTVRVRWRAARWLPLLYPIGWIYFSLRFLLRVLLGKNKIDTISAYAHSGERKALYKKLDLFDSQK